MLYEKPNTWLFEKKWRGLFYGNCPYVLYVNDKPATLKYSKINMRWFLHVPDMGEYPETEGLQALDHLHRSETTYRLEFRDKPATEEETA